MNQVRSPVHIDPEILGGTPVFEGTRVPFKALLDYLEGGESIDVFLDEFPSVDRRQAVEAIRQAGQLLVAPCASCLMNAPHDRSGEDCPGMKSGRSPRWVGPGRRTVNTRC